MGKLVVIGLLGNVLDAPKEPTRWGNWRPTVSLFQHDDLVIDRIELLHDHDTICDRVCTDIAAIAPETKIVTHRLPMKDAWDFEEVYGALHDFAGRYPFKPETEEYAVHMSTGSHVQQICLFLLAESRYIPGRLIQTAPPTRSAGPSYRFIDLDLSRYDRLAQRFAQQRVEGLSFLKSGIETRDARFNKLIERIESVAIRSRSPLLLMGPTGAGKSQLARRIYDLKAARRQVEGRLVEVNCATLRGDAAMSALFGHVKGAFTGAVTDRPGLLRGADNGILFLDEIGELGLDEQAMLLRALEEKRYLPVGSDKEAKSDFQLIAGTNRDLSKRVAEGGFREDLLARINLWTFTLPALKDRPDDIEPNLEYELEQYAQRNNARVRFNKEARARFMSFATSPEATWPANFRDLNAALTRMATLAGEGRITVDLVDEEIGRLRAAWHGQQAATDDLPPSVPPLDEFDQVQLLGVLNVCRASRSLSDAGRRLFSVSRTARKVTNDADRLRKYLARFGLSWETIRTP
jgi:transcriptional regulatory protein RtcR